MTPRGGWKTLKLPELVGSKEACELLGIQKATLHRWLQPGTGDHGAEGTYMITPVRIATGPVWVKADVVYFRDNRERLQPGPAPAVA